MISQIKIRRGTTAEWAAAHPVVLAEGEPGYDTTLKLLKIGDGVTNWASLPFQKSDNSDKLGGVHLSDIRLGQNILHNWDFRNPVNHRGVAGSRVYNYEYSYDRWTTYSATTLAFSNGYITIGAGGVFGQAIEGTLLSGQTVTVSIIDSAGVIRSVTGAFPSTETNNAYSMDGFGVINLAKTSTQMRLQIIPTANFNIQRVKCELGTVSTLHLDPPADYGVELAKCQRYCLKVDGYAARSLEYYPTGTRFLIPTTTTMRIPPSLASGSLQWQSTSGAQISFTSMQIGLTNFGVSISLNASSGGADGILTASNAILSSDL